MSHALARTAYLTLFYSKISDKNLRVLVDKHNSLHIVQITLPADDAASWRDDTIAAIMTHYDVEEYHGRVLHLFKGEPVAATIRDVGADGGSFVYRPSTEITVGPAMGSGFQWAAAPFQINLEISATAPSNNTEFPPAGTVQFWNGHRFTTSVNAVSPWNGLPHDIDSMCVHPQKPHEYFMIKGATIYIINRDTDALIETRPVSDWFPEAAAAGSPLIAAYRSNVMGNNAAGEEIYWAVNMRDSSGTYYRYEHTSATGAWTKVAGSAMPWTANYEPTDVYNVYWRHTGSNNGVLEVYQLGAPTGVSGWVDVGAGTSYYPTLPNNASANGCLTDLIGTFYYLTIGDTRYKLTRSAPYVVVEAVQYNNPLSGQTIQTPAIVTPNWTDPQYYELRIDPLAASMEVSTYGNGSVMEAGVTWTITGWGQTVLRGNHMSADGVTRLVVKQGPDGRPEYRPFDPAMDANPQEQFTQAATEVIAYVAAVADASQITSGTPLTVELLSTRKGIAPIAYQTSFAAWGDFVSAAYTH